MPLVPLFCRWFFCVEASTMIMRFRKIAGLAAFVDWSTVHTFSTAWLKVRDVFVPSSRKPIFSLVSGRVFWLFLVFLFLLFFAIRFQSWFWFWLGNWRIKLYLRLRDVLADLQSPVNHFVCNCAAYLDSQRFAVMHRQSRMVSFGYLPATKLQYCCACLTGVVESFGWSWCLHLSSYHDQC